MGVQPLQEWEDIVGDVEYDREEGCRHTTMEENRNDQEGQEQSGDMDASTSQVKSSTKKGRGPSKSVQTITPMFLEFDEFDMPIGKWESAYGKKIGNCAQRVNINVKDIRSMIKFKSKTCGRRVSGSSTLMIPRVVKRRSSTKLLVLDLGSTSLGYITEEQWKEFETYCNTDEFKAPSKKGKENAKNNKHRHHLGSKSYERARVYWSKTNRIPAESSTSSTTESTTSCVMSEKLKNQSLYWILARQTRIADGSWAIDPKNAETQQIANAIVSPSPNKKHRSRQNKEGGDSCGVKSRQSIIKPTKFLPLEDTIVDTFGEGCELLYWLMNSDDAKYDTTSVLLKASMFNFDSDKQIWVTATDVHEFLRGSWANVSLIHAYIMYLVDNFIDLFNRIEITFFCPQLISESSIENDYLETYTYVKNTFLHEVRKTGKRCKFIVALYVASGHWVLVVVDLQLGLAYEFDSMKLPKENPRKLKIAEIMMT
uniref:Ubiquitin-like protease family profile domain-containing protein n=1 Tax=Chenopodium quinoa TaxID=63459 RepID=A0A803MT75_CHEQI